MRLISKEDIEQIGKVPCNTQMRLTKLGHRRDLPAST